MVLEAESAPAMNQQLTLSLSKRPTLPPAPAPDTVPPTPPAACTHPRAYPGLEACYSHRRAEGVYPAIEGFWVTCPALVEDKVRNAKSFDRRWNHYTGAEKQLSLL